ncbi:MAG: hypothetical protein AB7N65_28125 [Vicinamibacterales bacterium]
MRPFLAMVVIGALLIPSAALPAEPAPPSNHPVRGTHVTTGVVRSISKTEIVITHGGKSPKDMTFTLDGSTARQGTAAVGTPVSVRYRVEGKTLVATAVTARSRHKPS